MNSMMFSCLVLVCKQLVLLAMPRSQLNNIMMALLKSCSDARLSLPLLNDKPNQPVDFPFPSRESGKKNPCK